MPDSVLVRAFRFRVKLLKASGAGASATISIGASASFSAGIGPGGASASASAAIGLTAAGPTLGDGGFQECSGLEIEMDVREHMEGGHNDAVARFVGRAKYQQIVLKRGMFHGAGGAANPEMWNWLQGVVAGVRPVTRYDGTVEVLGNGDEVVARWRFVRGLPSKLVGPRLDAKTGEIALEELHIAHEGLRLAA